MEIQALDLAAARVAARLADEIRVEMARKRKTAGELAAVIGVSAQTAGRRLNGDAPFSMVEAARAAEWLGVSLAVLITRAEHAGVAAS